MKIYPDLKQLIKENMDHHCQTFKFRNFVSNAARAELVAQHPGSVEHDGCILALPDGDVTRSRAVARLIPSQRWNKEAILAIKGVPSKPRPKNPHG